MAHMMLADDQRPHSVYVIGDWGGVLYGQGLGGALLHELLSV